MDGGIGEGCLSVGSDNVAGIQACVTGGDVELCARFPGFRPARFVAKYSHTLPCFAQRAQQGFSLLHFIFEAAHRLQLSRSLRTGAAVAASATGGDCAVVDIGVNIV